MWFMTTSALRYLRRSLLWRVPRYLWDMLTDVYDDFRTDVFSKPVHRPPCSGRLSLADGVLEDRTLLDAMLFIAVGGTPALPAEWNLAGNWRDLNDPTNVHVPTAADDVGIPGAAGFVSLDTLNAEVNSIVTGAGSTLRTASGIELKIDANPPASPPGDFPPNPTGDNYFGGSVIDLGRINANTSNLNDPTKVHFAGGAVIGPGDLNGNLVVGPASTITFDAGTTGEFVAGATLGMGAGTIEIYGAVALDGALADKTAQFSLLPGGSLGGAGSLDVYVPFDWSGGTLSPAGGVTLEGNSTFSLSGPSAKVLGTTLTNYSLATDLGGTGTLGLGAPSGGAPGGSIVNAAGIIDVSLPTLSSGWAGGITNEATFTGQAPASTPTTISAPFVNSGSGTLSVASNDALVLAPSSGTDTLNGSVQLDGDLTLEGGFLSTAGFSELAGGGSLILGGGMTPGTLTVASGQTAVLNGTVEVTGLGTLTGAGEVSNNGVLKLDLSSSTSGLGSYVESSTGTLDLQASGPGVNSLLAVTGTAQLSGTLELDFVDGYTPAVGDTWTVVTAGQVLHHFDTIPYRTAATYGTGSVTLTETPPPPN